jgi:spermidine/putrescine transport system permease protein
LTRLRAVFLTPAWIVTIGLFLLPLGIVAVYSLLSRGAYGGIVLNWTAENYTRIFDPLYGSIFVRTLLLATVATAFCLLLAFPLALFIAGAGKRRNLYLNLVMLPFWTSFLVRTYAWMFLLRDTGLINTALLATGIIREPLPLLYNDGAVLLGLVYGHLPFAVLPIYASLERLDKSLLEAAADLGARPFSAVAHVVLPLTRPGLVAAAVLAFIPSLGAFLTPDLLGGGKTVMIGNLIQNQFTTARDWPFGSALSLVVMAIVMVILMRVIRGRGEGLV